MNKRLRQLNKLIFGIFLTNEDVPYSTSEYRDKILHSRFKSVILPLVVLFWMFLFYLLYISFRFLTTPDTLYHVSATSETLAVAPYNGKSLMPLSLNKAKYYAGCFDDPIPVSGVVSVTADTNVFFDRVANGPLLITLSTDSLNSAGELQLTSGEISALSDCAVFELPVSDINDYTIAFDGKVTLGGELKEGSNRDPILHSGKVTISDKGAVSGQYYQTTPFNLERGDKLLIQHPSVQSSGFIYVNDNRAIQVIYNGKGSAGVIQRYKSENVVLKNTIWTKLSHDESIIFLWLFLVAAFTLLKFVIRIIIE